MIQIFIPVERISESPEINGRLTSSFLFFLFLVVFDFIKNELTKNQTKLSKKRHYVVDGEVGTEIGDVGVLDSLPFDNVGVEARCSF